MASRTLTKEVSFKTTLAERKLIAKIIARARTRGWVRGPAAPQHWYAVLPMRMDLVAVNANGCPIDFERLLAADDLNFLHDVAGIARFINRETGRLDDGFRPRFSRRDR